MTNDSYQTYLNEKRETEAVLRTLVARKLVTVAGILGGVYVGKENHHEIELHEGGSLWIRQNTHHGKNRLEISGNWPQDPETRQRHTPFSGEGISEITVSFDRSAEVIAREISRRFLPAYRIAYTKQAERLASAIAYRAETRSAIAAVANSLRVAPSDVRDSRATAHCYASDGVIPFDVLATVNGGKVEARIDDLTPAQFVKLTAFLKGLK